MKDDLLSIRDLTREDVETLFKRAAEIKSAHHARDRGAPLAGRTMALVFEKPSLRTRTTFEAGMAQLGGTAIYLSNQEIGLGKRESVPDVGRNLSRWVDILAARVFAHATVEGLAHYATIPVVNGLSDLEHPCQALADFFTLWERGMDLTSLRLAWVGDGNNVCHSIMLLGALMGTEVVVAAPPGYEPDPRIVEAARALGGRVRLTVEAREAVEGAGAVYTDTWISMGQEDEREKRLEAFQRYQLNDTLLGFAGKGALAMHCLPAHRGEEITDGVMDGPQSVVFDQAENRLHAQKAVVLRLLGE